jgi:hypothetical protein
MSFVLLILAMQQQELAATFSAPLILNAQFLVELMLNAENGLSITNSTTTAKLLFVTLNLVLVLLQTTTKPIARNAKLNANQVPIAILQHVFGLETNINANIQQRTVTMVNLALLILAMLKPDNVLTLTIAPLLNVTLMLIALHGHKLTVSLPNVWLQFATKTKDLANLFLIPLALILANNLLTVLLLNSVPYVTPTLDNVITTCVTMMEIAWLLIPILIFGTIARFALLMDQNVAFQHQNVATTPIVMTTTHAQRMSACQTMDSADILQDVTIATNAPPTCALLLLMENLSLALILQFLAHKMLPFSTPTLFCFPTMTRQNGLENVTRPRVVSLVLSMLNVTITMDVPPTPAKLNTASAFLSTTHGVILNWLVNQSTINLFLDWELNWNWQVTTSTN